MRVTLFLLLAGCLLFALAGNSLAVSDPDNDSYLSSEVEVIGASVQTFGKAAPNAIPSWINLGIKTKTGTHIPAMIMWDFDVDHNDATGGGSTLTMPFPTAEGGGHGPFKPDKGFEFYVIMTVRVQSDSSQTALCAGCTGGSYQCVTRGPECTACSPSGTYYQLDTACSVGQPDCYEVIPGTFAQCAEGNCYPLNTVCGSTPKDCAMGLLVGEWYAASGIAGKPFARGKVPLDTGTYIFQNQTTLCAQLPWFEIISRAIAAGAVSMGDIPFIQANPPKWQVGAWFDKDPFDGDDMFDPGLILNLVDFVPNTGKATGEYNQYPFCKHNINGDQNVDAVEVSDFLSEMGRSQFNKPCPTCKY